MKKVYLVALLVILVVAGVGVVSAQECTDLNNEGCPPPCTDLNPEACPPENVASCRASAARVELLQLEPWVANDKNVPCEADESSLITLPANPLLGAAVLFAFTDIDADGWEAHAGAAAVAIFPAGIAAQAATASAEGNCEDGFTSSSRVVGLTIGGTPIDVPPGHFEIALGPLGTLHLNETITTPTSVTQRAIWYEGPLDDIVVGEAQVDCEPAA
jgi:hypothetical protein